MTPELRQARGGSLVLGCRPPEATRSRCAPESSVASSNCRWDGTAVGALDREADRPVAEAEAARDLGGTHEAPAPRSAARVTLGSTLSEGSARE